MPDEESVLAWRASSLLHRYCRAIDNADPKALEDVFSEDCVLVVSGTTDEGGDGREQSFPGRDAVVQILSSLFAQRQWARHLVSNVIVEAQADGAYEVRSYFQYWMGRGSETTSGVGDYHASMREADGHLVITRFSAAIVNEFTVPSRGVSQV
jgi:ketosteroid isomerase-like protein